MGPILTDQNFTLRENLPMRLACVFTLLVILTSGALAAPPMVKLLPDSTKGCIISPDVQLMQEKWDQTQLGRWLNDPLMKPYLDDSREKLRDEDNPDRIHYGLTWDDVNDLARGEAAIALVHTPPKRPARVILVDVTGNVPAATAVLNKLFTNLLDRSKPANQRAASWKQDKVQGEKVTVFPLPANKNDPQRPPQMAYFIMQNILGAVEDEHVAKAIMGRIAGEQSATLESIPGYQAVMKRCQADEGKVNAGPSSVRWFASPLAYSEARRQIDSKFMKDGKVDYLRAFKNSGLGGVTAIGGLAHLSAKPYDVLLRAAFYAPPPYEKTLAGVKTPNIEPIAPPAWIPAKVSSYMAGSLNLPVLLDHIAPLYDYTIGDGDGAWADTLKGIRDDKRGPQVDLEKRLFQKMGLKALRVTDTKEPIDIHSERRLMIAELADAKEALSALEAFYANDPTADKKKDGDQEYWEIWPEERKEGSIPAGVAVVHNHLFYASQAAMLLEFFKDYSEQKQLASNADYKLIRHHLQAEATKRGWEKIAIHRFVRSVDAYKPAFELTRANKLPDSDTMMGKLLGMMLGQDADGKNKPQRANGALLPEFNKVQHYFLPSGGFGVREDGEGFQGWFFIGFSMATANGNMAQ